MKKAVYIGAVVAGANQQDAITSFIKTVTASEDNQKALFQVSESSNQVFLTSLEKLVRPASPFDGNVTELANADLSTISSALELPDTNEIIASQSIALFTSVCSHCDAVMVADSSELMQHCIVCGEEHDHDDDDEDEEHVDLAIVTDDDEDEKSGVSHVENYDVEDESLSGDDFDSDEDEEDEEDEDSELDEDEIEEALSMMEDLDDDDDDEFDEDEDDEFNDEEEEAIAKVLAVMEALDSEDDSAESSEDKPETKVKFDKKKAKAKLESIGALHVEFDSDCAFSMFNGNVNSVVTKMIGLGFIKESTEDDMVIMSHPDCPEMTVAVHPADALSEDEAEAFGVSQEQQVTSVLFDKAENDLESCYDEDDLDSLSGSDDEIDVEDASDEDLIGDDEEETEEDSTSTDDDEDDSDSDSENEVSKEVDIDDQINVDMLNGTIQANASPSARSVSLVYHPHEASGHRWYAFVDGMPVATARVQDVSGDKAEIFASETFRTATQRMMEQVGIKEGLTAMGFKPVMVAMPVRNVVNEHVGKATSGIQANANSQVESVKSDLKAALATAAVGINKGFFSKDTNYIKASLYDVLSSAGVRNAEVLIDNAFSESSDSYHKVLLNRAFDLLAKSVDARNEISTAVASASYQRAASTEDSLSSTVSRRLSSMGESTSSVKTPAVVAPQNDNVSSFQERASRALSSLSR